jgi:hypothetical protein
MAGVPAADRCQCHARRKQEPAPTSPPAGNEGPIDRALRVAVGAGALALAFVGPQSAWGWLGLVPLVTGVVGFCPLYALFGVSTRAAAKPGGA